LTLLRRAINIEIRVIKEILLTKQAEESDNDIEEKNCARRRR